VALEEGLVKIKVDDASHTGLLLQPGELARYDATSGETTTEHFDMRELLSWKEGILYFNKSSLQEVTSRLSRWYDVDFQLINYNGQPWYYSGEFRQDEYLDIILESMSYSKHFRFDITQDTVRMYFDESNKAFSQ
jgi:ferric-dicitrate binding protein FerR (iron transport regulator)